MPKYRVTCHHNTSFAEEIVVQAVSPEEACTIAVSRGNKGSSPPSEMLSWQTSIGWLQDDDYGDLDVPVRYSDAAVRAADLEELLRQIIAANVGYPLAESLIRRAHEILGAELPAAMKP